MPPRFMHGKNAAAYVGQWNFGEVVNDGSATATVDTADVTTYGDSDRIFLAGFRQARFEMSGLFDGSTDSLTEAVAALAGSTTFLPITYAFGGRAIGSRCRLGSGITVTNDVASPTGGAVTASFGFELDEGSRSGYLLRGHGDAARTSTGNGTQVDFSWIADGSTARQDAPMASGKYAANLHVFAKGGTVTTCTIKIQHSSAGAAWSDLVTFANVTGVGTQRITGTGSVKRYVREQVSAFAGSSTPSVTYAVSFGKPQSA